MPSHMDVVHARRPYETVRSCQYGEAERGWPLTRPVETRPGPRRRLLAALLVRDVRDRLVDGHVRAWHTGKRQPDQVGFESGDEHQEDHAEIGEIANQRQQARGFRAARSGRRLGHPRTFSTVGPSSRPARISPNTAGWPMRVASAPAAFATATTSASSSRSWRKCDLRVPVVRPAQALTAPAPLS